MILRLLLFLALMCGGFFALYTLGGFGSTPANGSTGAGDQPGTRRPDRSQDPKMRMDTGKTDAPISVGIRGASSFTRSRPIQLTNGNIRRLPVYEWTNRDSEQEPDNKMVFLGVRIQLFRIVGEGSAARAEPSGLLTADRARVELSQDKDQQVIQPSEDKLMEFWGLRYRTSKAGDQATMEIQLDHALALNTAEEMHVWTPNKSVPVRIERAGPQAFEVTGLGLDARIPAERDADGAVSVRASGPIRLEVFRQPRFQHARLQASSTGPLLLRTDASQGLAHLSMRDTVALRGQSKVGRGNPPTGLEARGDYLELLLNLIEPPTGIQRASSQTATPLRVHLRGRPVHLRQGSELALSCADLELLPDPAGEPLLLVARGQGGHSPVVEQTLDGKTSRFRCAGPVHIHRLGQQQHGLLGGMGMPRHMIPGTFDQLIVCLGACEIESPSEQLRLRSSVGMRVLRSEDPLRNDDLWVTALGEVEIDSRELSGTGNQGFVLHQYRPGSDPAVEPLRRLWFGRDEQHRYAFKHRAAQSKDDRNFDLVGTGPCELGAQGRNAEVLVLTSASERIDLSMPDSGDRLWQVGRLEIHFGPESVLRRLAARGQDCLLRYRSKEGLILGRAREIDYPQADQYLLRGDLAQIEHETRGRLRAELIDLRQVGLRAVYLRASRRASLRGRHRDAAQQLDLRIELDADEIEMLPHLGEPAAVAVFERQLPAFLGYHSLTRSRARYLFARGKVQFSYSVDQAGKHSEGAGTGDQLRLQMAPDGTPHGRGRLLGNPATFASLDAQERRISARARHIRFFLRDNQQYLTLLPIAGQQPELTLGSKQQPSNSKGTGLGAAPVFLTCEGRVEIDPTEIRYLGPVHARSLDQEGKVDPAGQRIDANRMTMQRGSGGQVERIDCHGDVDFAWKEVEGRCGELQLDLQRSTLTVRGIHRPAELRLAAQDLLVQRLEYNYLTRMKRVWTAFGRQRTAVK